MKNLLRLFFIFGVPLFLETGCATKALWQNRSFFEPAPNPRLEVFHSNPRQDFLIEYDELERNDQNRRRAYWLYGNRQKLLADKKPTFVSPSQTNGLAPIPVIQASKLESLRRPAGVWVVSHTNRYEFTIYADERQIGSHSLPVYRDKAQAASQVFLTPAAIVADVVIVVVPVSFIFWAESGFWPLTEQ